MNPAPPSGPRCAPPSEAARARSSALALCAALRAVRPGVSVMLDGDDHFGDGWGAPLVGLAPRVVASHRVRTDGGGRRALGELQRLLRSRRESQGGPHTGLVAVAGYDLLDPAPVTHRDDDGLPELVVLAVDASVRFAAGKGPRITIRPEAWSRQAAADLERMVSSLLEAAPAPPPASTASHVAATAAAQPLTSLPRERYVRAVEAVRERIRAGDVYQANLTQRFSASFPGDPFALYDRMAAGTSAPRSAFVDTGSWALLSVSPELFLRGTPDGVVETRPIKGTRPRGATPEKDRARAAELLASEKDRAELLMIVDLERNDLGRVCTPGSVRVEEPLALRSFATVHHLVSRVEGKLRPGTEVADLLLATFPGGSISGAPKLSAMRILRDLEPVRRNFYTGALIWMGDDGSLESSVLIRSTVLTGGRALVGAGGGVVADSDPEAEWREANHKARPLTRVLGFDPEEAH